VWSWIEAGKTEAEMNRLAAARYRASAEQIRDDLNAFFGRLLHEGLVREGRAPANGHAAGGSDAVPMAGQEIFVTPELCAYTDMQDLLFLDPIHDVDAVGWPKPRDSERD
jgi:hypothetical protein